MDAEQRIEALERIAATAGTAAAGAAPVADGSVRRRIDEGYCVLIGCASHATALAVEGLEPSEVRRFRMMVDALAEAEELFAREGPGKAGWRLVAVRDALYDAVGEAAGRLRSRAAFAFRHDGDDRRRRIFFAAYAPSLPPRLKGRRAMFDTVELKLR
ncbi:MAG: hypothetical protein M0R80_29400 [Proteobacteria bacterium]|jgi:hypothetical protein|nr:hypothetical protein [Pseudomonadota bacterium]